MAEYELSLDLNARSKIWDNTGKFAMATVEETIELNTRSKLVSSLGQEFSIQMDVDFRSKLSFDSYNWTEWYKANSAQAIPRYACRIIDETTGGLLLTLPLRSFQGRMRVGTPDYISAVISGDEYFTAISAYQAAGAFLAISKVLEVFGESSLSEEIARVKLEKPRKDQGPSSASMTLYGYRTSAKWPKTVVMPHAPKILRVVNGGIQMTFPEPDLFLRAGDTVSAPGYAPFEISSISYTVSADGPSVMTVVQEAA